jgi:hypothetical protein
VEGGFTLGYERKKEKETKGNGQWTKGNWQLAMVNGE